MALYVAAAAVGEDDSADHRGEQNHPRGLEGERVVGEQHIAELFDVGGRVERRARAGADVIEHAEARGHQQLARQRGGDDEARREVGGEAFAQFGEVDVDGHEHEQEHDGDGADVNHDDEQAEELGIEQQEHGCGVEEGENQAQHAVHGVARGDDRPCPEQQTECEEVEEDVGEHQTNCSIWAG